MKKLGLLVMPLLAISFLVSCGGGQASKLNTKSFSNRLFSETRNEEVIWKGDGSQPIVAWDIGYRFGDNDTGEQICVVPKNQWDRIKTDTFYLDLREAYPSTPFLIRVVDGWWSKQWKYDISQGDPLLVDHHDGSFTLEINFTDNPDFISILDEHDLFFTGSDYIPQKLYFAGEPEPDPREIIWENDGSRGEATWSSGYLFVGPDFIEEEVSFSPDAKFENDVWDKLRTKTFYVDFVTSSISTLFIQILDGTYNYPWPSEEPLQKDDKLITDNQDGTYTLTINFHQGESTSILNTIDEHGVLFVGQNYTPLRLYFLNNGGGEKTTPGLNIPLLAGSIGGAGLAILLATIFILIRHKIVKVDNIAYAKKASINPNFDEYVVSFDYKKRKANYFIFTEKKTHATLKDVKKEFSKDQRNGKLRKYIKKLFSR